MNNHVFVLALCERNPQMTSESPPQKVSDAESIRISWCPYHLLQNQLLGVLNRVVRYAKLQYNSIAMQGLQYNIYHNTCNSCYLVASLSHLVLGWLYVFSLFPPLPRPRPQKLFPLTSKPFELNLWYLAQIIYGSGDMYWMTFPWPWPKVTAVASISKNLLVCTIKWEPLIGSL